MNSNTVAFSLKLKVNVKEVFNFGEAYGGVTQMATYEEIAQRVEQIIEWAINTNNKEHRAMETRLRYMTKREAITLLMKYYDEGTVSLVSLRSPEPRETNEQMKRMAALLEIYKRKVDELMPAGKRFVPDLGDIFD